MNNSNIELYKNIISLVCFQNEIKKNKKNIHEIGKKDLNELLKIAYKLKLSNIVYLKLKEVDLLKECNQSVVYKIENDYNTNVIINTNRINELHNLHDLFSNENVDYALLKEYAFDGTYDDIGSICQNDFDVLIKRKGLEITQKILNKKGYVFYPSKYGKSEKELRYKKENHTSIDLHLELSPFDGDWCLSNLNYEELFLKSRTFNLGNKPIKILSHEDNIMNMIIHTAIHHNFVPFNKIVHCWNYITKKKGKVNWNTIKSKLITNSLSSLGWLATSYIEQIIGDKLEILNYFDKPAFVNKALFELLLPSSKFYWHEKTQIKLEKGSHFGIQLISLLDTYPQRLNFLANYIYNKYKACTTIN